ncbi:MAG TPA: type II secretion system major pseudopilin GspG [Longimicrobiaceae bacterium]|nr:type II secretion system major pseudopilin GspG [Longimicrobiaceae bacterium]
MTLIEIIVVIVVLGILAGVVGTQVFGRVGESRTQVARTQIEQFATQLDLYRLDNGRYPTTEQGLAALRERPTAPPEPRAWKGPYARKEIPLDPWGNPYVYRSPGEHGAYDLLSLGADGREGGEGEDSDVVSWK